MDAHARARETEQQAAADADDAARTAAETASVPEDLDKSVEPWFDGQVELLGLMDAHARARETEQQAADDAEDAARTAEETASVAEELGARLAAVEATEGVEHQRVMERISTAEQRLHALEIGRASCRERV